MRVAAELDLEPLAAQAILQLVRRSLGDQPSVVDHGDRVREPVGLVEVLRRQEHGRALGDEPVDRLPQREAAARVEPGGRLVEEHHGRVGDQRRGEIEPAAHAAGVRLRDAARDLEQVEALEQLVAAPLGFGARLAV